MICTRLIAPFTPYLSEMIFQNLQGFDVAVSKVTVHTQDWPVANQKLIDEKLESQMEQAREICRLIHAERQKAGIKIRQPLQSATVNTSNLPLPDDIQSIIKDETNIKSISWEKASNVNYVINLDTNLTPELVAEGEYRDLVRSVQVMRREQKLDLKDRIRIFAPQWPKSFESDILMKTLSDSIEKSDSLRIEKIG
jgi:valyl-tRNA synthetase